MGPEFEFPLLRLLPGLTGLPLCDESIAFFDRTVRRFAVRGAKEILSTLSNFIGVTQLTC
jgi:hypothetical protein